MQCNSTDCLTIKTVLLIEKLDRIISVNSVSSYVADSNSYKSKFGILHKPVSNHQKLSSNTLATNQSTLATTPTFYLTFYSTLYLKNCKAMCKKEHTLASTQTLLDPPSNTLDWDFWLVSNNITI